MWEEWTCRKYTIYRSCNLFNLTSSRSGLDWGTIQMKGTNGRGSDYRERKGMRERWREGGEG
jgi:hypothetical protein